MKIRERRDLLNQSFNAVYTPTEEVIVQLNGAYDSIHSNQFKHASNSIEWLNKAPTKSFHQEFTEKSQPNRLIESTNSPASSTGTGYMRSAFKNKLQQQKPQQSKPLSNPNNFVSAPDDDGDNSLMNAYSFDHYSESPQMSRAHLMHTNGIQRPVHLSMKSSTDLSQNRDAANLASGRDTSLLF